MFCPNCGKDNPGNIKFCGGCGKPLNQAEVQESNNKIIIVLGIIVLAVMVSIFVIFLISGNERKNEDKVTTKQQTNAQIEEKSTDGKLAEEETKAEKNKEEETTQAPTTAIMKAICYGDDVNCRKEPNMDGEIYFTIDYGTVLYVYERNSDNWYRCKDDNGTEFWVYGDYVALTGFENAN